MAVLTGKGAGLVLSARTGLHHQPPRSTCVPGPQEFVRACPDPRPQKAEGSCSAEGPSGKKGLEG